MTEEKASTPPLRWSEVLDHARACVDSLTQRDVIAENLLWGLRDAATKPFSRPAVLQQWIDYATGPGSTLSDDQKAFWQDTPIRMGGSARSHPPRLKDLFIPGKHMTIGEWVAADMGPLFVDINDQRFTDTWFQQLEERAGDRLVVVTEENMDSKLAAGAIVVWHDRSGSTSSGPLPTVVTATRTLGGLSVVRTDTASMWRSTGDDQTQPTRRERSSARKRRAATGHASDHAEPATQPAEVHVLDWPHFLREARRDSLRVHRALRKHGSWGYARDGGSAVQSRTAIADLEDLLSHELPAQRALRPEPAVFDRWVGLLARVPRTGLSRRRRRFWSTSILRVGSAPDYAATRVTIPPPSARDIAILPLTGTYSFSVTAGVLFTAVCVVLAAIIGRQALSASGVGTPVFMWLSLAVAIIVIAQGRNVYRTRVINGIRRKLPPLPGGEPQPGSTAAETANSTRNKQGPEAPTARSLWEKSLAQHNQLRSDYGSYETDPNEFFRMPILADITHPTVIAFHEAFAAADALRLDDHIPTDLNYVRTFADRVTVAGGAWKAAVSLARSVGDSPFNTRQQGLLRKAQRALALALDDTAPSSERTAAYSRVLECLERAEVTPPPSITVSVRRQLVHEFRLQIRDHPAT